MTVKHPEVLITEEDYVNAPEGIIIGIVGRTAEHKIYGWWSVEGMSGEFRSRHMPSLGEGEVIRWGQ